MRREGFSTLIDLLSCRAETSGSRTAFTFNGEPTTFAGMWRDIDRFAGFLLEAGLGRGERVVVALPNGAEFFTAFYGVQRAGGIAVPVFPGSGVERILSLARLCGAGLLVIPSDSPPAAASAYRRAGAAGGLRVVAVTESAGVSSPPAFPEIQPTDIAFLQYTSGSTGNPKGVMLTHANLLTNIRQMIAGMQISAEEVFVSWLPVYHDMGLILKTMVSFTLAAEVHLLPTDLRDVRPWLETIQRRGGTFTAAPDFAYRLVLRHVRPGEYDLSSLRVALNAAEQVRASTLAGFERLFGLKNVMAAGYGLAEATVGVSMSRPGEALRVDRRGRVSVGRPFPDVEVLIHHEEEVLPPGEVGEIAVRSPANSSGYFNNPEETARLFWRDGFIRSGDLGVLDQDGCLYIVSRKKNIIKRLGETVAPPEIEEVIDALPGVRFSAAVGIDTGTIEGEQVYVFVEVRGAESLAANQLHEQAVHLVERFHAHLGFRPARVFLLKPRTIPLTHNGKIRHGQLKELYLDGSLRRLGGILYPEY
jgi:acyl-CoA synthetase (AMP-forming)/AMP-acid ligase II